MQSSAALGCTRNKSVDAVCLWPNVPPYEHTFWWNTKLSTLRLKNNDLQIVVSIFSRMDRTHENEFPFCSLWLPIVTLGESITHYRFCVPVCGNGTGTYTDTLYYFTLYVMLC